tara:strand:+ start:170 stop:475 length:306 start_codon:yes stop_codon:yes gene_type:complete
MTHPLVTWLKANDLSRKQYAALIGVSDSTLHRLVNGTGDTTTDLITKVSDGTMGDDSIGEVTGPELYAAWEEARALRVSSSMPNKKCALPPQNMTASVDGA